MSIADVGRRAFLETMLGAPVVLLAGDQVPPRPSRAQAPNGSNGSGASKTLRVNGVTLHYLEWGSENAEAMVLLHPAPLNAQVWERFGPAMAQRFRVIAPDARGFGDSEWSDSYDGDVFLEDLDALIAALGLERPVLCGNSMGGTLAYMYGGLHPERVKRLILVDTGPGDPPSASGGAGAIASGTAPPPPLPPPGPFSGAEEAAAQIPSVMGAPFARAMVTHNLKRAADGRWVWKFDARVFAAYARSMNDPRKWPLWEAVRCPTLVLRGEHSPALSPQVAERMLAVQKNATVTVIPDAGHFIPIEAPVSFEAAVRQWLGI